MLLIVLYKKNEALYEHSMKQLNNTSYGQIPIAQMLSEKQDSQTIQNWFPRWLLSGIRIPNKVVYDFSTALIGALTRAFNLFIYLLV
jgi:hypothetical protein